MNTTHPQWKVVLTDYVWETPDVEQALLGGIARLAVLNTTDPQAFLAEARDCDALLNTYGGPISADVIAQMPKCRIIARYGIGVDTIDVAAATRAGIIVTNNPTYCVEEVAEHAMALMLAGLRKIAWYDRSVRAGQWNVPSAGPVGRIKGQVLGLVGFGRIAREVAQRAAAFGMEILFHDPQVAAPLPGVPGQPCALDELLARADVVSLHVPLTAATRGLIDRAALGRMKPGALLVNVARGPIVDTQALVQALDAGRLAGCVLDTVEPEPLPAGHALRDRENVLITPHAAWYSREALAGLQSGAPSEVLRVLQGQWPTHVVNPEVRGSNRAGL